MSFVVELRFAELRFVKLSVSDLLSHRGLGDRYVRVENLLPRSGITR